MKLMHTISHCYSYYYILHVVMNVHFSVQKAQLLISIMLQESFIMPAYSTMFEHLYYAQNYASIFHQGLSLFYEIMIESRLKNQGCATVLVNSLNTIEGALSRRRTSCLKKE